MSEITKHPTRRRFLMGGAAVAAAALGWQFRPVKEPDWLREALQPAAGNGPKLLVVYASMMGSSAGQAAQFAAHARAAGYVTQLAKAEDDVSPAEFDAIIMGSAIRASAWLPEIVDYAARHAAVITTRAHALFQCSMTCAGYSYGGSELTQEQRDHLRKDMGSLLEAVPALADAPYDFLPGKLDYDYLTPAIRLGYPIVSRSFLSGDFRSPDKIARVAARFLNTPAFREITA